jgi:hypothetical protein
MDILDVESKAGVAGSGRYSRIGKGLNLKQRLVRLASKVGNSLVPQEAAPRLLRRLSWTFELL